MSTIRRGDQTTTDEWLAKKPGAKGTHNARVGDIVLFRSALTTKTGVTGETEVPALISYLYPDGSADLHVFRARGLSMSQEVKVPFNADLSQRHSGAWRERN